MTAGLMVSTPKTCRQYFRYRFGYRGHSGVFTVFGQLLPECGAQPLIFAFESVIIGGFGSLWGTLLGGVLLGVAQGIGAPMSTD